MGVDRLINVTANTTSFFYECFFESFCPKLCLKVGGAAYTQVFTVYRIVHQIVNILIAHRIVNIANSSWRHELGWWDWAVCQGSNASWGTQSLGSGPTNTLSLQVVLLSFDRQGGDQETTIFTLFLWLEKNNQLRKATKEREKEQKKKKEYPLLFSTRYFLQRVFHENMWEIVLLKMYRNYEYYFFSFYIGLSQQ